MGAAKRYEAWVEDVPVGVGDTRQEAIVAAVTSPRFEFLMGRAPVVLRVVDTYENEWPLAVHPSDEALFEDPE